MPCGSERAYILEVHIQGKRVSQARNQQKAQAELKMVAICSTKFWPLSILHGIATQKAIISMVTALITSNPTH
jgi:hypothetical protein